VKQRDHYRQVLRLVHTIGRLVNPRHLPALRERRISLSQFLVLDALSVCDGPLRMAELAQESGLQPTELTRVVAGLEAKSWVRRSVDDDDSRAKRVHLTAAGSRAIRRVHGQATAELAAVWADFTHEEWHRLIDYLTRFEHGVRRTRAGQPPTERSRQKA
jgi:MarR family transcriptional regulator for hemolysin